MRGVFWMSGGLSQLSEAMLILVHPTSAGTVHNVALQRLSWVQVWGIKGSGLDHGLFQTMWDISQDGKSWLMILLFLFLFTTICILHIYYCASIFRNKTPNTNMKSLTLAGTRTAAPTLFHFQFTALLIVPSNILMQISVRSHPSGPLRLIRDSFHLSSEEFRTSSVKANTLHLAIVNGAHKCNHAQGDQECFEVVVSDGSDGVCCH